MSKVSIQGDQNGTGDFTIKAPNSDTDRTLTLPDEAGSVLTDVSDIEPQVKTATNATGSAPVYACRAWVNFDGTGTVSIRDSGNVSSITDHTTGRYGVNFANHLSDAQYSVTGSAEGDGTDSATLSFDASRGAFDIDGFNIKCNVITGGTVDPPTVCVSVFR